MALGDVRDENGYKDLSRPVETITFEVDPAQKGMRLDRYLTERMSWRSRTGVHRLIDSGIVRVEPEHGRFKKSMRLQPGQRVIIDVPPPEEEVRHDEIPLRILYEDRSILVVDKQAGLTVHPTSSQRVNTLINVLHHHYRHEQDRPDIQPRLCHRLDRETSGVLLVAKTKRARRRMQEIFEDHEVRKTYLAIAYGRYEGPDPRIIDHPLDFDPDSPIHIKMAAVEDGLPCRSILRVRRTFADHTLFELEPVTGRQHQLRAHLEAIGHPILADPFYGPRAGENWPPTAKEPILDRLALHARRLAFPHPLNREPVEIEAPLPDDLQRVLDHLDGHTE